MSDEPSYKVASLSHAECAHIEYSLQIYNWDRKSTAAALGVTPAQLGKLIKKYSLVEREPVSHEATDGYDGTPDEPTAPNATVLAECPNCSAENEVTPGALTHCCACGTEF